MPWSRRLRTVSARLAAFDAGLAGEVRKIARSVHVASAKLDAATRRKANAMLSRKGLDGNRSFPKVGTGLAAIGEELTEFGLEWDTTLNAHLFMGDSGHTTLDIAFSNKEDPFSPTPISNSMVAVSWYKRETDKFEVTAYFS